jgi:hypothetical protein
MPVGAWMHKDELDDGLPPYREYRTPVHAAYEHRSQYDRLQATVIQQVIVDRYKPGLANKLWGAVGELPSYLDRCIEGYGNVAGADQWIVQYPETAIDGGIVATAPLLPKTTLLAKEEWLIDNVQAELNEGRNVLIFVWHTGSGLAGRIQEVLSEAGIGSTYLNASRISTKKREQWVNTQIARGVRVMIVNPQAVQTGLNNLVHFSTGIWYEPVCDAIKWRQANGRLHRIGQTQEVRILVPVYYGTSQEQVLDLNALKVRASMALDGLDARDALQASGGSDNEVGADVYEIGEAIFHLLSRKMEQHSPDIPTLPSQSNTPSIVRTAPVQSSMF